MNEKQVPVSHMDIVIIANFCAALDKPTNSRFSYIADMFAKENDVELIGSAFSHGTKKKRVCDFSRFPYKVTLIEEPGYKKNISVQRFLSHRVWGRNVCEYVKGRKKPDVVYCAIPSLTAAALVGEYCNKNGIHFIVDIQDLWPEAFQMAVDDDMILKNPFDFEMGSVLINDSNKREALSPQDQKRFLEFVKNDKHYSRYYDAFYFCLAQGFVLVNSVGLQ